MCQVQEPSQFPFQARLVVVIVFSAMLAFASGSSAAGLNESNSFNTGSSSLDSAHRFALAATNFIQFLRKPPQIDTLIYKRVLFRRPIVFRTKSELNQFLKENQGKVLDNKSTELFALKYLSSNRLVFQQLDSVTNAWSKTTRLATFFGRSDDIWWLLTPNGAMTTDSTNGIYKLGDADITAFADSYRMATEFLRLGMYDLVLDSIDVISVVDTASGEVHFSGRSEYGGTIDGIAKCKEGLVSEISYNIQNTASKIGGRIINLTHEDGILKSIQVSNLMGDRSEPSLYSSYEVIRCDMALTALPESSCQVEQFLTGADRRVLTKANGEQRFFSSSGLVPVSVVQAPKPIPKRWILRIAFLFILILPFAILFGRSKRRVR